MTVREPSLNWRDRIKAKARQRRTLKAAKKKAK